MSTHTMIVLIFALSVASLWLGLGLLWSDRRHARRMLDREAIRLERDRVRKDQQILLNRIQAPEAAVSQSLAQDPPAEVPTIHYDDDDSFWDTVGINPLDAEREAMQ